VDHFSRVKPWVLRMETWILRVKTWISRLKSLWETSM
jgi:hypothetical protein